MLTRLPAAGLLACALSLAAGSAHADSASASADTGNGPRAAIAGSTSSFFLWSNVTGPVMVGPNQESHISGRRTDGTTYTVADPVPADPTTVMVFGAKTYADVPGADIVDKTGVDKPDRPRGYQTAADSSSSRIPMTSRYYEAVAREGVFRWGSFISASAALYNRATGSSAGVIYDPGLLAAAPGGYYTLDYLDSAGARQDAYMISGSIQKSQADNFAAVEYMVYDSRIGSVNPTQVGDPAGALWELLITANGDLTSKSDLDVQFILNPLAETAGEAGTPILTDSSGAPIDPSAIDTAILNAFTVADGTATLAPTPLFPLGTEYWVASPIDYGFADGGAVAGTALIPEPAAWATMLLGFGAVSWAVRRRRTSRRRLAVIKYLWIDEDRSSNSAALRNQHQIER
jgi:hypothetical protein